eukprot:13337214-Alexandrium_andersonii.AAC.1
MLRVYAAPLKCLGLRKARNSSAALLCISGPLSVRATAGTTPPMEPCRLEGPQLGDRKAGAMVANYVLLPALGL